MIESALCERILQVAMGKPGIARLAVLVSAVVAGLAAGAKPFEIMLTVSSIDPATHRIDVPIFRDAIIKYSLESKLGG